ncbi:MAG: hypothetical protein KGJ13_02475 [Patescibacteria group bacterium]|nr:hypothetical protein [Patescibacteria group bacterium]
MKQSSKRLVSMLVALVFLVVAFVVFFEFVQPAYSQVESLRGEEIANQGLFTSMSALVKQAQSILASYNEQSQNAQGLGAALPVGEDVAGALAQIEGIASQDNISLSSVAVSTPTLQKSSNIGNSSSTALLQPVGTISFKLVATGSYENFKQFIADLETNIRLFDIENVAIQPFTGSTGGKSASVDYFAYNLVLQAYYQLP